MPFKVTFLEGGKPLTKEITPTQVTSYPLIKNFTSHSYLVNDIKELHKYIQVHAGKGHCLLKGPISEEIQKESRAGKTINSTPTNWLVIDIDSAQFSCKTAKITRNDIKVLAESIIKTLPSFLHNTSYIAQASSSLGFKADKVSLHLFFCLDLPLLPSVLKQWLTNLNFQIDYYRNTLELTKTGWDVKYTLDRCVADNSRVIYITPPTLTKIKNPFTSDKSRIVLVNKEHTVLPSTIIHDEAAISTAAEKKKVIQALRKAAGMETRSTAKYGNLIIDGQKTQILLNPAHGVLDYAYTARGYEYYNFNGGDSNGYYHPIGKPDLIYNFKDEAIFRWIDIDAKGYQEYVDANQLAIKEANPENYFAVVSKQSDAICKIVHNTKTDELRVAPSDLTKAAHFYREHGMIIPETLTEWDLVFDPSSLIKVNYEQRVINEYVPSPFIKKMTSPKATPDVDNLATLCPTISKVLMHALGDGINEYAHFINWLAFVMQEKTKPNTCWFLWGTEGTGKGLLYNYVFKPMFGKENMGFHLGSTIEDKFDAWRRNKQLIIIDEFELPSGKAGDKIMERIKNWTAEEDNSIRDMQTIATNEIGIEVYIFFSNKHTMVKVSDSDRRFNIAPRQERKIDTMDWFHSKTIVNQLTSELQNFTNFMLNFPVNHYDARQALLNEAKLSAADATKTQAENFCSALIQNNLNHFIDLLYLSSDDVGSHIDAQLDLKTAQIHIRNWLQVTTTKEMDDVFITPQQMASVYKALTCTQNLSAPAIAKMLTRHGIKSVPTSYNGKKGRYYKTGFLKPDLTQQETDVLLKAAPGTQVANIIKDKTA